MFFVCLPEINSDDEWWFMVIIQQDTLNWSRISQPRLRTPENLASGND